MIDAKLRLLPEINKLFEDSFIVISMFIPALMVLFVKVSR